MTPARVPKYINVQWSFSMMFFKDNQFSIQINGWCELSSLWMSITVDLTGWVKHVQRTLIEYKEKCNVCRLQVLEELWHIAVISKSEITWSWSMCSELEIGNMTLPINHSWYSLPLGDACQVHEYDSQDRESTVFIMTIERNQIE